jgi:hypothetical protein
MNTKLNLSGAALALALLLTSSTAFAQGTLTPPGAPGPTMLTLSQVQPRTPISSVPITISVPGSYYLTTNVNVSSGNAITIATNGVTLDLNGFTISSTAASGAGYGILITSLRNITIANGIIQGNVTNNGSGVYSGNGFAYGIYYAGSSAPVNVQVSHVSVSGCLDHGIYLGISDSTVVESCTVRTLGSYGIVAAVIKQSSAIDCGGVAIYGNAISDCLGQSSDSAGCVAGGTAVNCVGNSNSSGDGLNAVTALNCQGFSNSGIGLSATTTQNCYGVSNGNDYGVDATVAENCYGTSSGSANGVYANNAQNCVGFNYGTGNGVYAAEIANGCYGYSASGTGVNAFIASLCHGVGVTPLSTSHNINSF